MRLLLCLSCLLLVGCGREPDGDPDDVVPVGPAGTVLVFDSNGIHRGNRTLGATRDTLFSCYCPGSTNWPVLVPRAFAETFTAPNPAPNNGGSAGISAGASYYDGIGGGATLVATPQGAYIVPEFGIGFGPLPGSRMKCTGTPSISTRWCLNPLIFRSTARQSNPLAQYSTRSLM